MTPTRSFILLQGPQSRFFRTLGLRLLDLGHKVAKVNFCGGDLVHWPRPHAYMFRKSFHEWPGWFLELVRAREATDLLLFGDRRPMQHEAVRLARLHGLRVHVLEEGYLQPGFITVERDGANGRSRLPRTPEGVRELAAGLPELPPPPAIPSSRKIRARHSDLHHLGNTLFLGLFPHYRTHRPYPILWEVRGIYPRLLTRKRRMAWSQQQQQRLLEMERPFFLFPLQLDSDTQVRQYSTFTGIVDSIAEVMCSFAGFAPEESVLAVKNHPIDNGLINYRRYVENLAASLGIADRVVYMEEADGQLLMQRSQGLALINSSMGLEALQLGRPVYCMGQALYAMPGLAMTPEECSLQDFWQSQRPPDPDLLRDFVTMLRHFALVPGNYYTHEGIAAAVSGTLQRLGLQQ